MNITYRTITHRNSNNSHRRGLLVNKWGKEVVYLTRQMIRDVAGSPLDYAETPAILRGLRSKYKPHVGKKQIAKGAFA